MKFIVSITGCLFLAGCATGYQSHTWSGGYKDKELGENHYRVEYYGNGTTSTKMLKQFWDKRASELCPNGYTEISSELGKSNSYAAGTSGVSFNHPWKKSEIKCS